MFRAIRAPLGFPSGLGEEGMVDVVPMSTFEWVQPTMYVCVIPRTYATPMPTSNPLISLGRDRGV